MNALRFDFAEVTYEDIKQALEGAAERYGIDPFTGLPKSDIIIVDSFNEISQNRLISDKFDKWCAIMHKQEK